jgi:hypothetical protein
VLSLIDDLPGPAGGHDAVTGKAGWFAVSLKERPISHDELNLNTEAPPDVPVARFDQGVSHNLTAGTRVPVRPQLVGVAA